MLDLEDRGEVDVDVDVRGGIKVRILFVCRVGRISLARSGT